MSKRAEKMALEAYPEETRFIRDYNQLAKRQIYQQGYEQAEKDLALTPDDIKLITKIHYEIVFKDTTGVKVGDVPSEVLRRFNEQRKEK